MTAVMIHCMFHIPSKWYATPQSRDHNLFGGNIILYLHLLKIFLKTAVCEP